MAIGNADRVSIVRRSMPSLVAALRPAVLLALTALTVAGCATLGSIKDSIFGGPPPAPGQPGYVKGFGGGVAADEPNAALAGRDVLNEGGSAADAAVAIGFSLSATLPSRAGLGAGGACIAYKADPKSPGGGTPEAILFVPFAPSSSFGRGDRPAGMPMLARGLFLLHSRHGRLPFQMLVAPGERFARFGFLTSHALARDLATVAGPLFADPGARAVFSQDGEPIPEGGKLIQANLSETLTQIRTVGVGDLYQGELARKIEEVSPSIGGPILVSELRQSLPWVAPPLTASFKGDQIAFLPTPADGGLAAAAAFQSLAKNPSDPGTATARGLSIAARWREGGGTAAELLAASSSLPAAALPPLPASTSFVTMDRDGNAVACSLTMDNLFGIGRMLPGLGFIPAASPSTVPAPLLAAAVAWNDDKHAFRAAVSGSGQAGAPMAVASGLMNTLTSGQPMPALVPDPGRANVIACPGYLPKDSDSCGWVADPREFGLASGG